MNDYQPSENVNLLAEGFYFPKIKLKMFIKLKTNDKRLKLLNIKMFFQIIQILLII